MPRWRGCRQRCAAGLEITQPSFDGGLPEAPVPAEANVRDPTGACLSPDPLGIHAEALGDLFCCQQPVQGLKLGVGARRR